VLLQLGEKFNLVLATTIYNDGTDEHGMYDEVGDALWHL
jgi:hypothetical protein